MNDVELVIKYLEEQNLVGAKKQYDKIKKNGTDNEKYWLAEQLQAYGYLEEAKELYEALIKTNPEEGEIKLRLAEILIEMDREDEAYSYLNSIEMDDPNYPAALLIEADLYEMQGLYEVSEAKLLHAKELLPHEPVIDYALGELYMTQGRFLEATRFFTNLLEENVFIMADVDINGRMAEALSAGGAFENALIYYEKSLNNRKDINTLFGYGLTAYQAKQFKTAIKAFNELKEMDADYHSLYLYLANSYQQEEQYKEALDAVIAGMKVDDYNKDLRLFAGQIALKMGNEESAEQYFREALVLDPEFIEAGIELTRLLISLEKYEDVLEITEMFSDESVLDPQFHWDRAVSFQQIEHYQEALNEYELAYNEFKNNRDFLIDYGYFLMEEGKRDDAVHIFQKLAKQEPVNEEWISVLERLEEN